MSAGGSACVVLIVEDEWLVRELVAEEFRNAGWHVIEASDGETAIAHLRSGHLIDLVFTDIQLGGPLSGWDIAERFRAIREDLPVVYTSGNAVDRSRRVPGSLFFDKPYQPSKLVEACDRML